jgi:DNA-directed RNA polymerase II subunit RPB4
LPGRHKHARDTDGRPGTLTPDSADEATTLIPSLAGKMDNETLQPILDELTKMRTLEWLAKYDED